MTTGGLGKSGCHFAKLSALPNVPVLRTNGFAGLTPKLSLMVGRSVKTRHVGMAPATVANSLDSGRRNEWCALPAGDVALFTEIVAVRWREEEATFTSPSARCLLE